MNGNPYFYADDRRICLQAVNTETANREEIAMLQSQTQALRHEMMMAELSACLKHGYHVAEEQEKKEEEPVKKQKTPFEIRVDLWNVINKEIPVVEEFLRNASRNRWQKGIFRVIGRKKVDFGFMVDVGPWMDLPLGLQEKMIRTAEEYLEELKEQKKDMEAGYNE